jgi:hypothetical protein
MRARADAFAAQAGLNLPDELKGLLYAAAPHAFAMAQRLRRGYSRSEEPCNVFSHATV